MEKEFGNIVCTCSELDHLTTAVFEGFLAKVSPMIGIFTGR